VGGLRIFGGEFRGRVVPSPVDAGSRPLLARLRQSLCDTLQNDIRNAGVLDLFAGSGVVGLEMLSRGASALTLVDSSPRAAATINETLALFHVEHTRARAVAGDVLRPVAWAGPELPGAPWGLVFVGTPYRLTATPPGQARLSAALGALRAGGFTAADALLVLQFGAEHPPADPPGGWIEEVQRRKISGRTGFAFWRAQPL
jgi:16S rRNA (guanine966-N2)-methyltransferase